ncbi:MAG: DEAD/DEAH box helicase, partial [Ruminococcus sp.]|nr:DEAD/DEAH box helicase [Ruminococcus sp.]
VKYYNIIEDICPDVLGKDDSVYGLPEELALAIQEQEVLTDGLKCQLRRYQEWGVKYTLKQKRVLLGDEMGLGKTIQAIAAMVSLRNSGSTHFIVVCPASVVSNWCREITKMSDLVAVKVHGSTKNEAYNKWINDGGVAVTTFETTSLFQFHDSFKFDMLVVDEAHYIKNPKAQRTNNVKSFCDNADRILFMTGTALENRVDEMVSLIEILNPEIASIVDKMEFLSSAPEFKEKVAPVYYRRKREDVLTELPDLIETKEWCTLNSAEEKVYEDTVLNGSFADVRRVSWNVDDINKSSKAMRLIELVEEAENDGRKVIVFSYFLDTISKVMNLLDNKCIGPINGSVPVQKRQEIVDKFTVAPAGTVLAAQIQAGGTGLNIQSASVVILCEPQFKPSIENQAISRAYRMGQTRNVLVYRLLCDDTVDEKITELLESKQAIFDAFADESAVADESFELDEKTFGNIISEEAQRINSKNKT